MVEIDGGRIWSEATNKDCLGSVMIYLDFWIIGLLLTWRDYETKSLGWGVDALLSAPINPIKCQCNRGRDWSVATQNLPKWPGPMEKVETCFWHRQ